MASLFEEDWLEPESSGEAAQFARDELAAEAAFAHPVLIAEFAGAADLALTTRHKYERCVAEFATFLRSWRVPNLRLAQRRDVLRFLAWLDGEEAALGPWGEHS